MIGGPPAIVWAGARNSVSAASLRKRCGAPDIVRSTMSIKKRTEDFETFPIGRLIHRGDVRIARVRSNAGNSGQARSITVRVADASADADRVAGAAEHRDSAA